MDKFQKFLSTERGMLVVNILFFLSMLLSRSGVLFFAYLIWILYLIYCIQVTHSRGGKFLYVVFLLIAAVMILANLYFLIAGIAKPF